jgi:hypothetical protein
LRLLATETGKTMAQIVEEAIESYRRSRFWAEYNAAYAALRADPAAWEDYQREIKAWDATLADGLEPETDEQPTTRKRSKPRSR